MEASRAISDYLNRLKKQLPGENSIQKLSDDELLRSELFSSKQMRRHGKIIAGAHKLSTGRASSRLLQRLADNENALLEARHILTSAVKENRRITPAEEWFLDNFYLIEEQIRTARRHLPKVYSRELPQLANGPSANLPRVYDIALEMISHGDGRVDSKSLGLFVSSYQSVTVLKLGELWAIPIMLRLALIENIRRIAVRISKDRINRNLADYWANKMTATAQKDPKNLFLEIADMARSDPPMVGAFVAEIARQLQGQGPALALPLTWIEQRLSEYGQTIGSFVHRESQRQATDQVSISNSISSLRFLGTMNWREFVETMSEVDKILREDPGDIYAKMDFSTRDFYRHVIENIAKKSYLTESEVARMAIILARKRNAPKKNHNREAHVGFYLIDKGLSELEYLTKMSFSPYETITRFLRRIPLLIYTGSIFLLTFIFTFILLTRAHNDGVHGWTMAAAGLLSILCTSQLAITLVNWLSTLLVVPRPLPRMDFSRGIPPECRTLVAVPTMLFSEPSISNTIEALEIRFLSNRDDNLRFALLTDFRDAKTQELPNDEQLLQTARLGIEALNKKYRSSKGDIFFLFHRPRLWNPPENIWMGYERKRGKLADLNSFLRGKTKGPSGDLFSLIVGDTTELRNIKYVITLDTDTKLPRDAAKQFIGTMAHPLNQALYDDKKKRVIEGYGILQPGVSANLPDIDRSLYSAIHGTSSGIDPYTRVVSDVYQDLFQEGSFIGKGIYDIDAFETALNERLPENQILSHDLIEGCYARSGLISDVQLYEDYPTDYKADVKRRHRWIRGDWQIARWVLSRVPSFNGGNSENHLSMLSQWKIFDNLRRSLTPAAMIIMLLGGWTLLPSAWFWTTAVMGIIFIPFLTTSFLGLLRKPRNVIFSHHLRDVSHKAVNSFLQTLFTLICLPYEAYYNTDAVLCTLWRTLISHKKLLEWNPSENIKNDQREDMAGYFRTMWFAPFFATFAFAAILSYRPFSLTSAVPLLFVWLVSPAVAWWFSKPSRHREARLTAGQIMFLRKLSRKTWAFFDKFVGHEDNWLPPDNYQEQPVEAIAHRTSPTNIGLSLLVNLTALDFGYITKRQFIGRTANTLQTMASLERHKGHFYNWYDTQSLEPLLPLYISSVDSGNLIGYLLVLKAGLFSLPDDKIIDLRIFAGIKDTLEIFADRAGKSAPLQLGKIRYDLAEATSSKLTLSEMKSYLEKLSAAASEVTAEINVSESDPDSPMRYWARAFADQCLSALDELLFFAPWIFDPQFSEIIHEIPRLNELITLRELSNFQEEFPSSIEEKITSLSSAVEITRIEELKKAVSESSRRAANLMEDIETMVRQCNDFTNIEYDFLFDKSCSLLAVGYNVSNLRRDTSFYDLLAAEGRFSNFVGIAQGKLPQESWFALGRLLTTVGKNPVLVSWSGSMFEYLMPLLVMPTYEHSLLDQTYKAAVATHIEYGKKLSLPWGISESGYNAFDSHLNYQYRAFGVPGLGLKRGLAEDIVIAPYASALALMVEPEKACFNLEKLAAEGFEGKFGFYEAIDYTPSRLPHGQSNAVISSYMAHHQGMSLLALSYFLLNRPMQKRFEAEPLFQSAMLLLQERVPKAVAFYTSPAEFAGPQKETVPTETAVRVFNTPDTTIPEIQLLSNGRYHLMLTNAGGSYSRWKDIAITRFREDTTCDNFGIFCYLRDVKSGEVWSTTYQPTLKQPLHYEAVFSDGRVEYRRHDHDFDVHTEIVVSPEDDIELRRATITNHSRSRKTIDVTSYAEIVITYPASDKIHPAFSNLFVQTEIIEQRRAILCTRRPRFEKEKNPWMFHLMSVHGTDIEQISYETDRSLFIGRGNTIHDPQALGSPSDLFGSLSDSRGSVLDPIVSIRSRITLDPEQSATVDMVFGITEARETSLTLVEKYQDRRIADRVFDMAWTQSQVLLRQINATESDAQLYCQIAGSLIYANDSLRADPNVIAGNRRGQSGLWGYAISGDLPIVLLKISNQSQIDLARQLIQAHTYWRLKGLAVDLMIWNEEYAGYRQILYDEIMGLISSGVVADIKDKPGGIFVRSTDQMPEEDRILIQTVAHVIISGSRGKLVNQIKHRAGLKVTVPRLIPSRIHRPAPIPTTAPPRNDLLFFNGLGGFSADKREYIISTSRSQITPLPWANVLANSTFGTVISESGMSYTWSENAHEFRLTPWHNDPVSDSSGEAFYIRDDERGPFWSAMPLPRRGFEPYITRHGLGYSVFEHTESGIYSEAWVYTALNSPVKFTVLKIKNKTGRPRRLSVTGYAEWVLGDLRTKTAMHIITEVDSQSGAIFARNPYNMEFPDRVAFFNTDALTRTITGNRTEFLGRNGTLKEPAVMKRLHLSGKVGVGMDPCAAIQIPFDLADEEEKELVFILGMGKNFAEAQQLAQLVSNPEAAADALDEARKYWSNTLDAIQIKTPDPSLNTLANSWLLYQTLACRIWARTGYYQSGGAFGFRDQLQDVMALIHTEPNFAREQLLLCASRQFEAGDVQHWWHPPIGRGVRSQCSDDYLWLPLTTCYYVSKTGDRNILEESVPFINGRPVNTEEDSYYDLPARSTETASLYEHCVRAVKRGIRFGEHGLPLMGSGDWNDSMNMVGIKGKGESVWLGFFLYEVLTQFEKIANLRGDASFSEYCKKEAAQLRLNIEQHAWDGLWYRRAFFDNGALMGSAKSQECRIDSIAQSWSVLSGAGESEHTRLAMESLSQNLIRRDIGIVQLLNPPFDKSGSNPGYIKGYVPGVRENGGQYTHAAVWAAMAFAALGDSRRAWEILTMINPINHAGSPEAMATYKVEPYVVAADIYAFPPHTGRGGWTWYTGAAGLMYRLIVESLLGLKREAEKLYFAPCLPAEWEGFSMRYRWGKTVYNIAVTRAPKGKEEMKVIVDNLEQDEKSVSLVDDGTEHKVDVII
ncbi:MAG: cyclic beta 1-2 glucan synthetase [Deltaproteobacteria bacterium]|nr:cyclic beta 1-2 glucan synthetase [Deltaproteobacteria bacterium]